MTHTTEVPNAVLKLDPDTPNSSGARVDGQVLRPFLLPSPEAFMSRLTHLPLLWKRRWDQLLADAGFTGAGAKPLNAAFGYAMTRDAQLGRDAVRQLQWLVDEYPRIVEGGRPDTDTWMHAAPMCRRAISLDWVWDFEGFGHQLRADLTSLFVQDALRYPYATLHYRVPPHANNQGLAQALALVVVGYLFGWRRATDETARRLFRFGLTHLFHQLASLPRGAYGSEGSTYAAGIEAPLAALAAAVLEEITGDRYFDLPVGPHGLSWASIVRHGDELVAPSGLMLPWNQYGYQSCWAGSSQAYLAHRTGNARFYERVTRSDGWTHSGNGPWLTDDHVWQFAWLPENLPNADREPAWCADYLDAWSEPHVAATLMSEDRQLYVAQLWNWTCTPPGRTHIHPNAVIAEAFGSPLLIDGHGLPHFELAPRLASRVKPGHLCARYDAAWWAAGSLGAHSCVIVDDAIEMVSPYSHVDSRDDPPLAGTLTGERRAPGESVVRADVRDFYKHTFSDLSRIERTTALLDDRLWLVMDHIDFDTERDITSQFVLRDGEVETPSSTRSIRIRTAEHVVLDILPVGASKDELVPLAGYPSVLEQRCLHYRRHTRMRRLEQVTLFVPQLGRALVEDLSAGWDATVRDASQATVRSSRDVSVHEAFELLPAGPSRSSVRLEMTRRVHLPSVGASQLLLEMPQSYEVRLWINDEPIALPHQARHHHGEPDLLPRYVPLPEHLASQPDLTLRVEYSAFRLWGIRGRFAIHRRIEPDRATLIDNRDHLRVRFAGRETSVDLSGLRTLPQPSTDDTSAGISGEEAVRRVMSKIDAGRIGWETSTHATAESSPPTPDEIADACRALCVGHWDQRMLAAKRLGSAECVEAVMPLCEAIREHRDAPRTSETHNVRVAVFAAWALGRIGDRRAIETLVTCLDAGRFYGLRRVASEAIASLADTRDLELLRWVTADSDMEVCEPARVALRRLQR